MTSLAERKRDIGVFELNLSVRNSTKLKNILLKYTMALDMDDDGLFKLTIMDKMSDRSEMFEGKSYSIVLGQAHSYLLKELKKEEGS